MESLTVLCCSQFGFSQFFADQSFSSSAGSLLIIASAAAAGLLLLLALLGFLGWGGGLDFSADDHPALMSNVGHQAHGINEGQNELGHWLGHGRDAERSLEKSQIAKILSQSGVTIGGSGAWSTYYAFQYSQNIKSQIQKDYRQLVDHEINPGSLSMVF